MEEEAEEAEKAAAAAAAEEEEAPKGVEDAADMEKRFPELWARLPVSAPGIFTAFHWLFAVFLPPFRGLELPHHRLFLTLLCLFCTACTTRLPPHSSDLPPQEIC